MEMHEQRNLRPLVKCVCEDLTLKFFGLLLHCLFFRVPRNHFSIAAELLLKFIILENLQVN